MAMLRAIQTLISHGKTNITMLSIDGNDKYKFPELASDFVAEFIIQ